MIYELLLISGSIWLGSFLAGFFGAEQLGLRLRAWLFPNSPRRHTWRCTNCSKND